MRTIDISLGLLVSEEADEVFLQSPVFTIYSTLPPACHPPTKGEVFNSTLFIVMDNTTSGEFAITREEIYEITTSQGLVPQCDCCGWSPRVLQRLVSNP